MKKLIVLAAVGIDALVLLSDIAGHRPHQIALICLGVGLTGMLLVFANSGRRS